MTHTELEEAVKKLAEHQLKIMERIDAVTATIKEVVMVIDKMADTLVAMHNRRTN